jgi:pyridinium-3,5-bisthiocarboxylic acid mononucleotide nickel chelatase
MRIAYLDCFSGISGDMFLGALLDAGVPAALLVDTVAQLNIGAQLEIHNVTRNAISATKVDVIVHGEKERPHEPHTHAHEHGLHEHNFPAHEHAHEHKHDKHDGHGHEHEHGRSLSEIKKLIAGAKLPSGAKELATDIFDALGEAEAKIHGIDIEQVHFHEVGAVDAIVDIVCAAVGTESLKADRWLASALNVGGGVVECAHGVFPVPAPATLELLQGAPLYSSGLNAELVTPTGAAIVHALVDNFSAFPPIRIGATGYGAGTRDFKGFANVLRLVVGESVETGKKAQLAQGANEETIAVLEATVDDLNPQVIGYTIEQAFAAGALDVTATPVQMKKSRPGTMITVLARPQDSEKLSKLLFRETTTLGIRVREEKRLALDRESTTVQTQWGPVRVKVGSLSGAVANATPEYEDCRRIAAERDIPLKTVMQEATRLYDERVKPKSPSKAQ